MAIGAALQAVRLARWRGWLVRQPAVLTLHAGYLWVVLGTALAALAADPASAVSMDAALHAFTSGGIGAMTMAVMARLATTRGGGARANARLAMAALLLVNLSAACRVAAPFAVSGYAALLTAAALLWAAAWSTFLASQLLEAVRGRTDGT